MYKRKCKITYICHGSTIYSEDNRLFDNPNYPPLNTNGRAEIQKLAQWLVKRAPKVDAIYSSACMRAEQSAKILAKYYHTIFEIAEGLHSKKNGILNGFNFEQIETLYPDILKDYHDNRADYQPSGGESLREFDERVEKIIKKIVAENINKRLIIVTQADVIQAVIRQSLNIPIENQTRIHIPTGSATQINYYEEWESLVYASYVPL